LYPAFNDYLYTVNTAPELDIFLPAMDAEWYDANCGWQSKTTHGIMGGMVMAVDGSFQGTAMPTRKEVANRPAYFSGHYQEYRMNCIAGIYSNLQFGCFGVTAPGSTNDAISWPMAASLKRGTFFPG
jgi:hypothetical protein